MKALSGDGREDRGERFLVVGYAPGSKNTLAVAANGDGGLNEVKQHLGGDDAQYGASARGSRHRCDWNRYVNVCSAASQAAPRGTRSVAACR